jgi:hypothetical protein
MVTSFRRGDVMKKVKLIIRRGHRQMVGEVTKTKLKETY